MIKHIETKADGSPHFRFELEQAEHDAGMVAFLTGPIGGTIALGSEVAYDVTEDWIAVHKDHVGPLKLAIHGAHHAAGRYLDVPIPALTDAGIAITE